MFLRISKVATLFLLPTLMVGCAGPPTTGLFEVHEATIPELQEAMEAGSTTSAQVTASYLARIAAYDQVGPNINAMVWLNPNAVADAEALDREREELGPRGPLHGIPVVLKDNYDTYGLPTSAGTLAMATNFPPDDAFQVRKLREAGAVILGKAAMHELAGSGVTTLGSLGGQTRNPYDLRRHPGGSSGGTGASIAASFAAVGWGTDTCISIRMPAAVNYLFALRPTKGLSSIDGIFPMSQTLDVGAPMARTVTDLAIALDATIGRDEADPATDLLADREVPRFVDALDPEALAGARLGVVSELFGREADQEEAAEIVRGVLQQMVELGADTLTVELPTYGAEIVLPILSNEGPGAFADYFVSGAAPIDSVGEILRLGLGHRQMTNTLRRMSKTEGDTVALRRALADRIAFRTTVRDLLDRHDLDALVFPTMRGGPDLIEQGVTAPSSAPCGLSSVTGLPEITIPAGFTSEGLPIGMEMLGRTLDDARLVGFAYAYEQNKDPRVPPTSTPPLVDGEAPAAIDLIVRGDGDGYGPPSGSEATFEVAIEINRLTNWMTYEVSIEGVASRDVIAVVIRYPEDDGQWVVARRLQGPGLVHSQGELRIDYPLLEKLEADLVVIDLFTMQHPFGAARGTIRLPE